jgi:TonB family protein
MNNLLSYLLQSTLCLSLFWLMFRIMMRKERFFGLTRMLLVAIVILSAAIPFIHLPLPVQSPVRAEFLQPFAPEETGSEAIVPAKSVLTEVASTQIPSAPNAVISKAGPTTPQLLFYGYLAGCLIAFLILVRGLVSVLLLTRKARSIPMEGFRLLVVEGEIPAFSFGRWVVLSQSDYAQHQLPLLAHEQAHIRLHHFYDLLLLEIAIIIYWFNPVIYWMAKDLKEIHEFQADDYTLTNGIDATQYQLLIIQKGVGSQRFALANSFNHCQIKKRITMMNKQKTNKAGSWKVATFLPLLALLLMAFGRKVENGPPTNSALSSVEQVLSMDSTRQWSEADFLSLDGLNLLIKMGKTPNWKDPEFASFEKNGKWVTVKKDYFNGFVHCEVQIDSRSQLWIGNRTKLLDWNEFRDSIRSYVDFDVANNQARPYFHKAMINGVIKMSPQCYFFIMSDRSTPIVDYQRFLNIIGNTILEIRGKYSMEIFKMGYSKLSSEQREQIDIMVPLMSRFLKTPQLRQESAHNQDTQVTSNSGIVYGKVTLADGKPLQKVPVRIKGTNTITLTDKEGAFKMADVPKNCVLEFQNVGLKSANAKPDFENPMIIKMELSTFWIDRVKVICRTNDNNPPKPLPKHGFASNMTNSPVLFVVDGVIIDKTQVNQIETDDVKSVSILNAKTATEKYGQLAKNGVMEIQTKGKVNLTAENGNVVVEVNEYADNQKMDLHTNNIIDEMPEFKGGMKGLMKFISGNIKYPDQAQAKKAQGNVEVNFVIDRNGKVENVSIANAIDTSLDAEAIRVISAMPDWNPGLQNGQPVDVSFTIPIQFAIK